MRHVFGYLRVSGRGQIDGDGFDRQKDTISRYCESKGWKVVRWFTDGGVSGTVDADARPGFSEMLNLLSPATSLTIVVERADRLARDLIVSELACQEARQTGAEVYEAASDTELTNSEDPTRVLIRQVLGALAEWNKNVTVKRLRAARDRIRIEKGRCEGIVPFPRTPEETEVANQIYSLHCAGQSYRQIRRWLRDSKIPSPTGLPRWSEGTVYKVLARIKDRITLPHPDGGDKSLLPSFAPQDRPTVPL